MRPYRARTPLLAISVALLVLGCYAAGGPTAPPATLPPLSISNGTNLQITLFVNGQEMGTIQPSGYADPMDRTGFPPAPWHVEARTESGRVLAEIDVVPENIGCTTPDPAGQSGCHGAGDRADLSCGRLDLWAGVPLLGPMPPESFPPRDCDP